MAVLVDGNHLNQYVAPALIKDIRDTEDNFTKFFGTVNQGAITAAGVNVNKLINDISVITGIDEDDEVVKRRLNGKKGVIPWMPFTTEALEFSYEELRTLAFDKEGEGRKLLQQAVSNAILLHTLHNIAPSSNATNTPVIETSGAADGAGRLMLTPKDITNFLRKTDIENPVGVLAKNHLLDLQENATAANRFNEILINQTTMTPVPYAGVNFVANDLKIRYDAAGAKRAINAAAAPTDRMASVFIDKSNTMFYLHNLMFITTDMKNDQVNAIPRSSVRIFGYFMGTCIEDNRKRGVIIDGFTPEEEG